VLLLVWGVVLLATQAGRDAAALGDGLLLTLAVLVGGSAAVALVIGGVDALWRVAVAPLAHVEAEATGGVAVLGRGRLGAGPVVSSRGSRCRRCGPTRWSCRAAGD
jgi:hypothetical protein